MVQTASSVGRET